MAFVTSDADRPLERSAEGSRSTCTWRCLPPYGYGMAAPGIVASPVRTMLLPRSKISASDKESLESAS
jgi:hypothetical protein